MQSICDSDASEENPGSGESGVVLPSFGVFNRLFHFLSFSQRQTTPCLSLPTCCHFACKTFRVVGNLTSTLFAPSQPSWFFFLVFLTNTKAYLLSRCSATPLTPFYGWSTART